MGDITASDLREFFEGIGAGRRALIECFTRDELALLIFSCDGWRDDPGTGKRQLWRTDYEHFQTSTLSRETALELAPRLHALGVDPLAALYGVSTAWWKIVEETPDGQWPDFDGWLRWAFEQNG
jgi:hypothetical protein